MNSLQNSRPILQAENLTHRALPSLSHAQSACARIPCAARARGLAASHDNLPGRIPRFPTVLFLGLDQNST